MSKYPHTDAIIVLARTLGISAETPHEIAEAFESVDFRSWLVAEGLLDRATADKMSDGAVRFFATGAMTERVRVRTALRLGS